MKYRTLKNFKGGVANLLLIWILSVAFSYHKKLGQIFNEGKIKKPASKKYWSWYAYKKNILLTEILNILNIPHLSQTHFIFCYISYIFPASQKNSKKWYILLKHNFCKHNFCFVWTKISLKNELILSDI